MYKLCFYVPESHLEIVKSALFEVGAGQIGNYDQCCWQTLGQGQYRPLPGAVPYLGQVGQEEAERVDEYKVELVVADALVRNVISALKEAHPYEEPAYDVWCLDSLL